MAKITFFPHFQKVSHDIVDCMHQINHNFLSPWSLHNSAMVHQIAPLMNVFRISICIAAFCKISERKKERERERERERETDRQTDRQTEREISYVMKVRKMTSLGTTLGHDAWARRLGAMLWRNAWPRGLSARLELDAWARL